MISERKMVCVVSCRTPNQLSFHALKGDRQIFDSALLLLPFLTLPIRRSLPAKLAFIHVQMNLGKEGLKKNWTRIDAMGY